MLSANKLYKNNNTIKYLGYQISFLKKWIEFQFSEGMNWENYGKWEFDHVKPFSSFDLKNINEHYICFSWKNLQPLWKCDNILKSDKINEILIKKHLELADKFLAQIKEGELSGTS